MKRGLVIVLGLLLVACNESGPPTTDLPEPRSGGNDEFAIVNEQHLLCYVSQAHWSGMEIVFTRRNTGGELTWLADGVPVYNQKTSGNTVSGQSTYTEFEPDDGKSAVDLEYLFRLDYVKGQLDVFL